MITTRTKLIACTALALMSSFASSMTLATPRPFYAEYDIGDNLATMGVATFSLTQQHDRWIFKSRTQPTGLFKLLGDKLRGEEQANLIEKGQRLLPTDWYSKGPRHDNGDRDSAAFNWQSRQVKSHFEGQTRQDQLNGPAFDRLSIYLEVNRLIDQTDEVIKLALVGRDGVEPIVVTKVSEQTITVPAGTFKTIVSERVKGKRMIRAWHAIDLDNMPVRLEQYKDDKMRVRLEMKRFEIQR